MSAAEAPWSVSRAVDWASAELTRAGVPSPRTDAELLAAHVLGVSRGHLVVADGLYAHAADRFRELVAARARRVPLQHLVGRAPFRRLELAVGPGVFVPRPETELLAGWGIALASIRPAPVVVDLCAGCGAIALAVAHEVPGVHVYAVEHDGAALDWLRRNAAERASAGDRPIEVVAADVTAPATPGATGATRGLPAVGFSRPLPASATVDVVLCNPPYVPDSTPVPPEVGDHDPPHAVFGGPDGLAVIRPVIDLAAALLRPGGGFGVEHDDTHGDAVAELLAAAEHFYDIVCHRDLAGRPRYTTARRA